MPIIFHASKEFTKRYKCELSLPDQRVPQVGRLDSWSLHFYRIGRKPMVIMMNDATLWTVLVEAKGVTTSQAIVKILLDRIANAWESHGATFNPSNQSLLFFPRNNRRLIGSMNDAVSATHFWAGLASQESVPVDWSKAEDNLNNTPYKVLGQERPRKVLAMMLEGGGC